jgi:hypothetical protein
MEHKIDWHYVLASNPVQFRCSCGFCGTRRKCNEHLSAVVLDEVLKATLGETMQSTRDA